MSEIEALNTETGEIEVFSITQYTRIRKDPKYRVLATNPDNI